MSSDADTTSSEGEGEDVQAAEWDESSFFDGSDEEGSLHEFIIDQVSLMKRGAQVACAC